MKPNPPDPQSEKSNGGATIGYEADLWAMADALRGSMDAAEYKHVALGLIFLKYVSDAFEELRRRLESERDQGADPEYPDEYRAENVFWVPQEARWGVLQANARQPDIGELVDEAMAAIERDNPALRGVLPKEYARPALDKRRLGQLIDMISNISVGDQEARSKDVLGRVYEYFLSQFASAKVPTRARRKVQTGDIVYSTVRPNQRHYGLLNELPQNPVVSTGFVVLRGVEDLSDTGFLYRFLSQDHVVEFLQGIAENSTTAYPSIKPSDLGDLELELPPLEEQQSIAEILGVLDDKIPKAGKSCLWVMQ